MNVFYNFEVDDGLILNDQSVEIGIYLDELKSFVKSRFNVLVEEISKEEAISTKMILLVLPVNSDHHKQGILFLGYSKELIAKMQSCLSEHDILYLQSRLSYIFDSLN